MTAGRIVPSTKKGQSGIRTFTLNVRTRNELNGSRGHWSKTASKRKSHRQIAMYATMAYVRHPAWPLRITMTRVAPRRVDETDGGLHAALKSIRDGIADGLGLKNDEDPRLEWIYNQTTGGKGNYAVVVKVEELGSQN